MTPLFYRSSKHLLALTHAPDLVLHHVKERFRLHNIYLAIHTSHERVDSEHFYDAVYFPEGTKHSVALNHPVYEASLTNRTTVQTDNPLILRYFEGYITTTNLSYPTPRALYSAGLCPAMMPA